MLRPCLTAFALAALTQAVAAREITGTLVRPSTGEPIAGQQLVLDRAAGDYTNVPFAMLIFGTPQPAIISRSVSDARGRFRFTSTNDRGRSLTVRVAGPPFRSRGGYAVRNLRDSLHPKKALAEFDSRIMHKPGGGFMPVP
jgi:hypothetical protein